jgi:transposase
MSYNFIPYGVEQIYLLPPSILDWVSEEGLARFIYDTVTLLDEQGKVKEFYSGYAENGIGGKGYHPVMLLSVLLYGYCLGINSSRQLARALESDVNFRFLSGNQQPDFRTLSDFRKRFSESFQTLFIKILELCREVGLVKVGRVALDGTKIKANAAMKQNRTREGLEKEVKKILEEAERVDQEEDRQFGKDKRGDELPEGLRTSAERLARIREAQKRLEERAVEEERAQREKIETRAKEEAETGKKKRGRKPKTAKEAVNEERKANMTDPDSRILKTRTGLIQGYNAQAAVDTESQIIVGQLVTEEENDIRQLGPVLKAIEAQSGQKPDEVLADAGYSSEENLALETEETEFFIPNQKDWKRRKKEKEAGNNSQGSISEAFVLEVSEIDSQNLPSQEQIPEKTSRKKRMAEKLKTERGKEAYRHRGKSIEPVFGQIKETDSQGFSKFRLRGKKKVQGEWALACSVHNLLKLFRSGKMKERKAA